MLKSELRRQIRDTKRQFTPQQLEELSLPVIERLKSRLADARVVLAYYSLPDEVCTHRLIDDLLAMGKVVLLPKVIDEQQMEIRRYYGVQDLQHGVLGLFEPGGEPFTDYAKIDVALVPGMAFDSEGHRLGRGRGYYDRFLRLIPSARTIGVCFPFQIVPQIPMEPTDIPVSEMV